MKGAFLDCSAELLSAAKFHLITGMWYHANQDCSRRHSYFFHCFSEKIRLDVSSESSARQRIHMKNQALFLRKIKVKNQNVVCCNFCLGL